MQKINFLTLSTIASLVLIGCGSSSTSTSNSTNTGTGYYKDAAVAGVDYVCGTQIGKTDKEGKFTFEEGKECKFSLAGIPLRTTSADKLTDGGTILEDNPKVAKFLQSIDADGDLSNGIQITDEVLTALTTALEESNSTSTLPEGTVLTEVVASVGHDVTDVTGDVRTDEQVQEHLTQTQTEITKELLAGKTFYVVVGITDPEDTPEIQKAEINQAVTEMRLTSDRRTKTLTIEIKGNTIAIVENGSDKVFYPVIQQNGFIQIDDKRANGDGHRLYANEADAKTYFNSLSADGGGESSSGSYTENGKLVTVTRAQANINRGNPPQFQFNLKHDISDGRDMVQFTTKYKTQEEFNNAFDSSTMQLSLDNGKLSGLGMEIAGEGWQGNQEVSSDFFITVTKNNNGTYDLQSNGYFVTNGRKIEKISATNIKMDK